MRLAGRCDNLPALRYESYAPGGGSMCRRHSVWAARGLPPSWGECDRTELSNIESASLEGGVSDLSCRA